MDRFREEMFAGLLVGLLRLRAEDNSTRCCSSSDLVFLGVNNLQISLGHFKNAFRLLIFLGLIFIKGTHLVSGIMTSAAEESSSSL